MQNREVLVAFGGAIFLVLSIPDIVERAITLARWLGMTGAEWHWWNYLGFCGGFAAMLWGFSAMWVKWRGGTVISTSALFTSAAAIWENAPEWVKVPIQLASIPFILAGGMLIGLGPFLLFIWFLEWVFGPILP